MAAGIFLGALLAGLAWAIASPVGSSPDDNFHQASIWCPSPIETSGCPLVIRPDGEIAGVYVPSLVYLSETSPEVLAPCFAFQSEKSGACIGSYSSDDLVEAVHVDRGDYPGPYYHIMHVFVGSDVTQSVLTIRFVNVLIAVALMAATGFVAARGTRRLMSLAVLGSVVPLGMFVLASVNPSSWALTGVTVTWLSLHTLLVATERRTVIGASVLVVLGGALAAASRADAAAYVVLVSAVIAVLHSGSILVRPGRLVAPLIACALGLTSFLSSAQSSFVTTGIGEIPDRSAGEVLFHNLVELPGLYAGVFGLNWGLGWLDTRLPAVTYVGALVVAGSFVLSGLRVLDGRKIAALVLLGTALVALPINTLQAAMNVIPESVQPRYLLPLVPALLGVALIGVRRRSTVGFGSGRTIVVYLMLVVAHTFALHANIRRYVTGQDISALNLGTNTEWWWATGPSPMEAWAMGSLGFAVAASSLFLVAARRDRQDERAEPVTDATISRYSPARDAQSKASTSDEAVGDQPSRRASRISPSQASSSSE